MKILSRKDIDKIAERVLKAYKNLPENSNTDITHIDPELLLTNLLGFKSVHFFILILAFFYRYNKRLRLKIGTARKTKKTDRFF